MVTANLVASALIEREGKFLLIKAKVGKPKGLWNLPGGRVEDDETFHDAAVREAKEETGIDVEIKDVVCIGQEIDEKENAVVVVFKTDAKHYKVKPQEEEIEKMGWFSAAEIEKMPKTSVTFNAYGAVLAFKNNKRMNYLTRKISADGIINQEEYTCCQK